MRRPRLSAIAGGISRRRVGAGLALIAVIAVVAVVVLANRSSSPSTAAGASQTGGAATVARRDLVQTDTESGTLSYSDPQTVYNRLGGTITWLPPVGREIKPGGTLYKVDGQPVILMSGRTPAYRTLSPAVGDGNDVLQLNRNLVRLGFNPDGIVVDDVWQPATTIGVELFQESLGEAPTGTLSLGEVVFLPGPQLISTVDGTVGANASGGSAAAGSSASQASAVVDPSPPEFVSLTTSTTTSTGEAPTSTTPTTTGPTTTSPTTPTSTTQTTTSPTTPATPPPGRSKRRSRNGRHGASDGQQLGALVALLKAEIAQLKQQHAQPPPSNQGDNASKGGSSSHGKGNNGGSHSSHSSNSSNSSSSGAKPSSGGGGGGGGGGSASAILQTTSARLVVTVDLDASLQSEASVGEHVMVELPDGKWVPGKVTAVSAVAQTSSGSGDNGGGSGGSSIPGGGSGGSSSTIPVTITLSGHQSGAGLDQAAVSVNFAKARAKNVLSVPVTALVATSGASYAVQEAAAPHKLIPVKTGLFAAGDVQIRGPGIYPGLQVTDSQG